jgi:rRNA-processing protein FCF1
MAINRSRSPDGLMTLGKPIKILLDTNFLMIPIRFGVNYRAEIERIIEASFILITTSAVVDELKQLKNSVKIGELKEINFALALTENITIVNETLSNGETVDDQLIRFAKKEGCVVATTDSELKRRLRKSGIPVIFLRQTRHLVIEGLIKHSSSN